MLEYLWTFEIVVHWIDSSNATSPKPSEGIGDAFQRSCISDFCPMFHTKVCIVCIVCMCVKVCIVCTCFTPKILGSCSSKKSCPCTDWASRFCPITLCEATDMVLTLQPIVQVTWLSGPYTSPVRERCYDNSPTRYSVQSTQEHMKTEKLSRVKLYYI